jgi:hypothetical protein
MIKKLKTLARITVQAIHQHPPSDAYYALRAKKHVSLLKATFSEAEMLKIRDKWRGRCWLGILKYFDFDTWLKLNLRRAAALGLDKQPMLRVCDIGSGFGYFPYICKFFNCEAVGVDIPDEPIYDDVMGYLGVPKVHHTIRPQENLPDLGGPFDLITGFQVMFNVVDVWNNVYWGPEDWRFFLHDLLTHHLNEGGRIYFELNYPQRQKGGFTPEIRQVFKDMGASIWGNRIMIRKRKARPAYEGF